MLPDKNYFQSLHRPSVATPMPVLFSGCFAGLVCGYEGVTYNGYPRMSELITHAHIEVIRFCPEDFSFGTPRVLSDIHGGNGFDVLDGKARVLSEDGEDWTEGMLAGAKRMLEVALEAKVQLAVLMDVSAACGSQVIYLGNRKDEKPVHQKGPGLCAAMLMRNGIRVMSQRDYKSMELLFKHLDPNYIMDETKKDHHETDWYLEYFS